MNKGKKRDENNLRKNSNWRRCGYPFFCIVSMSVFTCQKGLFSMLMKVNLLRFVCKIELFVSTKLSSGDEPLSIANVLLAVAILSVRRWSALKIAGT